MNRRLFYGALSILSLVLGGIIYIFGRPSSYIAEFFTSFFTTKPITHPFFQNCDFIKYYFTDYLWAFSMFCALNTIPTAKNSLTFRGLVVILIGIVWEFLQFIGTVSGTGDIVDIIMYITAVLSVVLLDKILKKRSLQE